MDGQYLVACKTCIYYNQDYSTCDFCQDNDYEFYQPNYFTLIITCILALLIGMGFTIVCMVLYPGM